MPEDGHVILRVFDLQGREVAKLVDEERKAGVYQEVKFDASRLATGMYVSRLEFNGRQLIKKMVFTK